MSTEQKEPREGDRVRFNPGESDTVIEGLVTSTGRLYGRRNLGLVTKFSIDGLGPHVMLGNRAWTTNPEAADGFETFLAASLSITKRQYQVGDEVTADDLAQLPAGAGVTDAKGVLWQLAGDTNLWSSSQGTRDKHPDFLALDFGPIKLVVLP